MSNGSPCANCDDDYPGCEAWCGRLDAHRMMAEKQTIDVAPDRSTLKPWLEPDGIMDVESEESE